MVKTLNVVFDDSEFVMLELAKKKMGLSWREFILYLIDKKVNKK